MDGNLYLALPGTLGICRFEDAYGWEGSVSDSSMVGGAVVYSEISQAEFLEFLTHQSRFKGCANFLSKDGTADRWIRLNQYPAWLRSR